MTQLFFVIMGAALLFALAVFSPVITVLVAMLLAIVKAM